MFKLYSQVHKEIKTIDQFKKLFDRGELIGFKFLFLKFFLNVFSFKILETRNPALMLYYENKITEKDL